MTELWFQTALLPGGWADRVRVTLDGERIASIKPGVAPDGVPRFGAAVPGLAWVIAAAIGRGVRQNLPKAERAIADGR